MGRSIKIIKDILGDKAYYSTRDSIFRGLSAFKGEGYPYNLIKANSVFHNSHVGERCFILGNGPSLKKIDFNKLSEEFVFSVNFFNLVDGYQNAKSNVHLWMDFNIFDMRPEVKNDPMLVRQCFHDISKLNPICFVPAEAYPFIKKEELDKTLNFKYLYPKRTINDSKIHSVDLTKSIYSCATVVQYAVQIAVFMGFSEIYLLGCDSTNILTHLNTIMGQHNTGLHAYSSDNDNTESAIKELMKTWKTNRFLYDHYMIFLGYDLLNDYCNRKGVKLINCSDPTLITEIERANFYDVL